MGTWLDCTITPRAGRQAWLLWVSPLSKAIDRLKEVEVLRPDCNPQQKFRYVLG